MYTIGNICVFDVWDVTPTSGVGATVLAVLPIKPLKGLTTTSSNLTNGNTTRVTIETNGHLKILGNNTIDNKVAYSFSFVFPFVEN